MLAGVTEGLSLDNNILVVGGGIGGLAVALALQQHGRSCTILEREPRLGEAGAGLLLAPNAVWVLDCLGVLEQVRTLSVQTAEWRLLAENGALLQRVIPARATIPALSITRTLLQRALLQSLPPKHLLTGHEVIAATSTPDGASVDLADGTSRTAALVIGADGLRSPVRQWVLGTSQPIYRGYVGWRALVDWVPEQWRGGLVTETWGRGMRFGIAPVSQNRAYWYATANRQGVIARDPGERKKELLGLFAKWHAPVCELIERTPCEEIFENAIFDRPMAFSWSRGRMTLVGDAAHPMTPNLGQGAAMALEDAWILAKCLTSDRSPAASLRHYERLRRMRKARILWQSRAMGRLIQIERTPWVSLRDGLMKGLPAFVADAGLQPIFSFRA